MPPLCGRSFCTVKGPVIVAVQPPLCGLFEMQYECSSSNNDDDCDPLSTSS
ncbi:Hypothetical predicted protein, partial [Marmota monax]